LKKAAEEDARIATEKQLKQDQEAAADALKKAEEEDARIATEKQLKHDQEAVDAIAFTLVENEKLQSYAKHIQSAFSDMDSIEFVDPSEALSPIHKREIYNLRQKMKEDQDKLYEMEMMMYRKQAIEDIKKRNRARLLSYGNASTDQDTILNLGNDTTEPVHETTSETTVSTTTTKSPTSTLDPGKICLPRDLHYCTIVTPAGLEFKSPSGMVGAGKKVVVDIKTPKLRDAMNGNILIIEIRDSNGHIYKLSDLSVDDVLHSLSIQQMNAAYVMKTSSEIRTFLDEVVKRLDIASILRLSGHPNDPIQMSEKQNGNKGLLVPFSPPSSSPSSPSQSKQLIQVSLVPSPSKQRKKYTLGQKNKASIRIQSQGRKMLAVTIVNRRRSQHKIAWKKQNNASIAVQTLFRGWCTRKEVFEEKIFPARQKRAVTLIQSVFRMFQIRTYLKGLNDSVFEEGTPRTEEELWAENQYHSATLIQKRTRGMTLRLQNSRKSNVNPGRDAKNDEHVQSYLQQKGEEAEAAEEAKRIRLEEQEEEKRQNKINKYS